MFFRHPVLSIATLAYLGLVAWITLTPQSGIEQESIVWVFADFFAGFSATEWLTFSTIEFLANIALFVPFGLFFVLLLGRRQWWLAVLLSVVATVAIEFAQESIANRVADPRDILANSLGGLLGVVLGLILTYAKARKLRTERAQRSAAAAGRVHTGPVHTPIA